MCPEHGHLAVASGKACKLYRPMSSSKKYISMHLISALSQPGRLQSFTRSLVLSQIFLILCTYTGSTVLQVLVRKCARATIPRQPSWKSVSHSRYITAIHKLESEGVTRVSIETYTGFTTVENTYVTNSPQTQSSSRGLHVEASPFSAGPATSLSSQ